MIVGGVPMLFGGAAVASGPEDFTTYTEVDPNARLSATASVATASNLISTETYLYKDQGAGYWNGLITSLFTFRMTSSSGSVVHFFGCFSNELSAVNAAASVPANQLGINAYRIGTSQFRIALGEMDAGAYYAADTPVNKNINTDYYFKLVRDPSVGSFGTAYLYIYSDAARTVLLDTLTLTLHGSLKSYRYNYAIQTYLGTGTNPMSFTVSDMTITNT